jgi:AcrR family transcriptional regulator
MPRSVKGPRKYDSSGRQAQARQARARVLAAARVRFLEQGYGASTVPAIAEEAGVSVETVYKAFGNKAGLLKAVCDVAIVGDDEPLPLNQRDPVLALRAEPDPRQKIRMWSELYVTLAARAVPLFLLARGAAANDPAAADVWLQGLDGRRSGMAEFAHHLAEGDHLRADIDEEEAADVLWALNSPELWELLVLRRGWSPDRFGNWIADVAIESLLRVSSHRG